MPLPLSSLDLSLRPFPEDPEEPDGVREYGSSSEEPEWTFFFRVPVVNWPVVGAVFGPEMVENDFNIPD